MIRKKARDILQCYFHVTDVENVVHRSLESDSVLGAKKVTSEGAADGGLKHSGESYQLRVWKSACPSPIIKPF